MRFTVVSSVMGVDMAFIRCATCFTVTLESLVE